MFRQKALYNFYEAETVSFRDGFSGHILAPKADFNFLGGNLSGQIIAKSMTSYSQANLWNGLYEGASIKTPEVSEPHNLAFFLLLAGYLVINRKKRVATPTVTLAKTPKVIG